MSRVKRPRLSLRGDPNAPTTEPIGLPVAETSKPSQEKIMEQVQEPTQEPTSEPSQEAVEQVSAPEPTAKQMAAAEEANALRMKQIAERNEKASEPKEEPQTIIQLASQGMDVLHDAMRAHNAAAQRPEYVPPPRTPRQMAVLQEELEAGRRTQLKAKEQAAASAEARAKQAADAKAKEGFTSPVHRPGNMVPDPMLPAGASAAGTKLFDTGSS